MTKRNILIVCAVFVILLSTQFSFADDIRGYAIPEYYMVASHHDGEDGIEGQHGFWLRRIYFGYNADLGKGWSARVRLEMNSPAFDSGTLDPYVKSFHVKKKLSGGASLLVGIMEPPSFNLIEKFWVTVLLKKLPPTSSNLPLPGTSEQHWTGKPKAAWFTP
jgi:hypothetical protein